LPVQFITDALDTTKNGKSIIGETKAVTVENVSDIQQNLYMLEKGSRVLVHFEK
jgi:hypothetical protein